MVCLKKENFIVIPYTPTDIHREDVIIVDDLMAGIISLLNLKGYTTNGSCQGHLYSNEQEPSSHLLFGYLYHYETKNAIYKLPYISFEKGIKLPNIPYGFEIDKNCENLLIRLNPYIVDQWLSKIETPMFSKYYMEFNKLMVHISEYLLKWVDTFYPLVKS